MGCGAAAQGFRRFCDETSARLVLQTLAYAPKFRGPVTHAGPEAPCDGCRGMTEGGWQETPAAREHRAIYHPPHHTPLAKHWAYLRAKPK